MMFPSGSTMLAHQPQSWREGWSRNALFKPLRLAVTGRPVSPPIDWTLALLPRDEAVRRLDRVLG